MRFPTKSYTIGGYDVSYITVTRSETRDIGILGSERCAISTFANDVESDDVVWDVGANVGMYSTLAGVIGAETHAFEIIEENAMRVAENAATNGAEDTVTTHEIGLFDENGTTTVRTGDVTTGYSVASLSGDGERTVETKRGEDVEAPSPTVMKIDTEGAEKPILDGMGDRLDDIRVLYIEVHETKKCKEFGYTRRELLDQLDELGFDATPVEKHGSDIMRATRQ